jgi:hypothetical protein
MDLEIVDLAGKLVNILEAEWRTIFHTQMLNLTMQNSQILIKKLVLIILQSVI